MTTNVDGLAQALCHSPTGCAFLLTVEENDLAPDIAADLLAAMTISAVAIDAIDMWAPDYPRTVTVALENGPRLMPLAQAIMAQPAARTWFAPVQRAAQWVILGDEGDVTSAELVTPSSPPTEWELYAQKPVAEYSSTAVGDTCAILIAMEHHAGDFYPTYPIRRYHLRASPAARIYEVDGPQAWHHLATRYPALDEEGRTVPDWGLVANDWDAVHLSLGGLLTAQLVRVEGPGGFTELQGWDSEQTTWMRWCFDEVERLPNLAEIPEAPVPIEHPNRLWFPEMDPGPGWLLLP
jgi:hypothetical protein